MFWILCFPASCNKCLHAGTPVMPTVAQFCLRSLGICCAGWRYVCIPVYTHTCIYFLLHFLWVLQRIFVTFPFFFPFSNSGCMQHRWGMGISCSTGTLGWSSTVASSTSCFLSSCRRSPICDYLQDFITVVPKLWHCSSAGDLHSCNCCSLVSRCTPVLTWKSGTVWPYFTAVGACGTSALLPGYVHWRMDVTGEGPAPETEKLPTS